MPAKIKSKARSNGHKPAEEPRKENGGVIIQFYERGTSGLREFSGFITEAYNAALYWPAVQPLYARLRRSMPEIVTIRNAFTFWSRNIRPIVDLPDEPTDDDKAYQTFLESEFENWEGGYTRLMDNIVNYVPFMGWGWWEVLPSIRNPTWVPPNDDDWRSEADDNLIGIRRFAWRDSSTFYGWDLDENKRLKGFIQQDVSGVIAQPIYMPLKDSLHLTFGDSHNPEGLSPLEAIWRLERIRYGYEVIMGIGSEHAAGHLLVNKTEKGDLTPKDTTAIETAARNLLSAQEGNFGYFPFGLDGKIVDVTFQAAPALLDIVKHYTTLVYTVYLMQFVALNTMTNTGALASQVDSTDMGVFSFNSMMDGFAKQFDEQIGKRLYLWNKDAFPNLTQRPRIRFSHIDKALALSELGSFLQQVSGIINLGDDDYKAIRKRSGFLPENEPSSMEEADIIRNMDQKKTETNAGVTQNQENKEEMQPEKTGA